MPYAVIENFAAGVDRTRPIHAGPQGSLWEGINCHLTRGGDIEKCKAFTSIFTLAANTFGMTAADDKLYVFGSAATPGTLVTTSATTGGVAVAYQRLQHSTGEAMTAIKATQLFNGLIYAVAQYTSGDIRHFYNGTMVTDWVPGIGSGNPVSASGEVGEVIRTHQRKMYAGAGSVLDFSVVDDTSDWTTTTGSTSGFINMANHQGGSTKLTALAVYQRQLAIFSRTVIQIWNMYDDPLDNLPAQIIEQSGTRAQGSVLSFADYDVFYLADSGIRSLRARDSSTAAAVNDVGVPIDSLVQSQLAGLTEDQIKAARAVIDPSDGRFWMAIGNKIFVFSYFPSKRISGWTWYEPGFTTDWLTPLLGRVWLREGNTIRLYGAADNATYDSSLVTVSLPFLSLSRPASFKQLKGIDIMAEGDWNVDVLVNPNLLTEKVQAGVLTDVTMGKANYGIVGDFPLVAPKLTHQAAVKATLSQLAIHYSKAEDE